MHRHGEPRHPASTVQALVSMQRLSFNESLMLGTSLPHQDTNMFSGNSGVANDSSLVVAARKPSAIQETGHPASTVQALVSMQSLSFNESLMLGTSLPYKDTNVFSGNCGAANDLSLVVAKSDARKPSAMQARCFLPVQQGKENIAPQVDSMPAKLAAEVNVGNDAVKAGNVGDTNTGTQQVMPNRNICVPLGPVPSMWLV